MAKPKKLKAEGQLIVSLNGTSYTVSGEDLALHHYEEDYGLMTPDEVVTDATPYGDTSELTERFTVLVRVSFPEANFKKIELLDGDFNFSPTDDEDFKIQSDTLKFFAENTED